MDVDTFGPFEKILRIKFGRFVMVYEMSVAGPSHFKFENVASGQGDQSGTIVEGDPTKEFFAKVPSGKVAFSLQSDGTASGLGLIAECTGDPVFFNLTYQLFEFRHDKWQIRWPSMYIFSGDLVTKKHAKFVMTFSVKPKTHLQLLNVSGASQFGYKDADFTIKFPISALSGPKEGLGPFDTDFRTGNPHVTIP